MQLFAFLLIGLIYFSSCSKGSDSQKPVVTIITPIAHDTIPNSESEIMMQFTATDNSSLSSIILEINDANGSNVYADTKEIYGTSYSYKNSFVILKHPLKTKELIMTVHVLDENKNETIVSDDFFIAGK
jgi:hypothetical protein